MPDFFGLLILIVLAVVLLAFFSYLSRTKSSSYGDWKKEQNRLALREIVRQVREEEGDYMSLAKRPAKKRAM